MLSVIFAATALAAEVVPPPKIPTLNIGLDADGDSVDMPLIGFLSSNETGVASALSMGTRLIDTALTYDNEVDIARAVAASGIHREELFISTKVPGGLGTAGTIAAHEQNLQQLNMSTVDLLLTHFPCGFPTSPGGGLVNCSKAARQATWRGLESLYRSGKARAIGVTHYCQKHLEDILEINSVHISVNREEWHVGMGRDPRGLVSFCKKHGISYQSSSPLCGSCAGAAGRELITGPLVTSIGKAHNVSGPQVALKWLVQSGSPVTPGSSNPKHLREDLDIVKFTLTESQMVLLNEATSPPSADFPAVCNLD